MTKSKVCVIGAGPCGIFAAATIGQIADVIVYEVIQKSFYLFEFWRKVLESFKFYFVSKICSCNQADLIFDFFFFVEFALIRGVILKTKFFRIAIWSIWGSMVIWRGNK